MGEPKKIAAEAGTWRRGHESRRPAVDLTDYRKLYAQDLAALDDIHAGLQDMITDQQT